MGLAVLWHHAWSLSFALAVQAAPGVVVVPASGTDPSRLAGVLQSCDAVLGVGRCRAAAASLEPFDEPAAAGAPPSERAEPDGPSAPGPDGGIPVVWLRVDAGGQGATLHFASRGPGGQVARATRELHFAATDAQDSRWAAIGLVIGAYVLGQPLPGDNGSAALPTAPPPKPMAAPPAPSGPASSRVAIDLYALGGPGLDRGAPRFGFGLAAQLQPPAIPLAPRIGLEALHRFDDPTLTWWSGDLGVGWAPLGRHGAVVPEVQLSALALVVRAAASDLAGDRRDHATALRYGARAAGLLHATLGRGVSGFAGVSVQALSPRVSIEVLGQPAGSAPSWQWLLVAGARILP